jgi:hypothetical protein
MSAHSMPERLCAGIFLSLLLGGAGTALAQGGPPAFPQKFEVRGPENASFAFAVTQPGPIVVDVQWRGVPLRAVLAGPNLVQQQGSGRLAINYNVTPQDLQKGTLWTINVSALTPNPAATATGQVNVRTPPADPARVTRATQGLPRTLTEQQVEQINAALNANVDQHIRMRTAEFSRELALRKQGEEQKVQSSLAPQPSPGEVRSRAVNPAPGLGTPKIGTDRLPPPPRLIALPSPEITALNQPNNGPQFTSGGPFVGLVIRGTSFGTTPGRVFFTIPTDRVISPCAGCAPVHGSTLPDGAILAPSVAAWTDTSITLTLPDLTMVYQYLSHIFIARSDNVKSNRMVFQFNPRTEPRYFRSIPGDRRYTSTVVTRPMPAISGATMMHIRFPAFPFAEFVGERGNDEYFVYTDLAEPWRVNNVRVTPLAEISGIPPEIQTMLREAGGAYIEGTPSGTNLYLNVRWWINALFPYTMYAWSIEIVGPAGTPDGVIVR